MIVRYRPNPAMLGCAYFRLQQPAHHLRAAGHDVGSFDKYQELTGQAPDVVVMQRPLDRISTEHTIPMLQSHGVAVVIEIDDDYDALQTDNIAYDWKAGNQVEWNVKWLGRACARADLVTCTTPALARRYAGHGRYAVIPNFAPDHYLSVEHSGDGRTVGWGGNIGNHPGDLETVRNGAVDALAKTGGRWLAVGDTASGRVLRIPREVTDLTGYKTLQDWPGTLARLDVGLVPLADNAFNAAKSCLKMLEYAALGVYPVVAPTPDNLRLHQQYGIGVVARKPREWTREIVKALRDPAYRLQRTREWRTRVAAELTYSRNAWRWMQAWEDAARYRTQRRAA